MVGKRGHIHNDHEGLGNVAHWDNKRQHMPYDATHDGTEHLDVDSQHYMDDRTVKTGNSASGNSQYKD